MERYLTDGIFWREGEYKIKLIFDIQDLQNPHVENYSFFLDRHNIEKLMKNTTITKEVLEKTVTEIDDAEMTNWQFVYPNIY